MYVKGMLKNDSWPTVSIIVPAYNAEKTIERCLISLTNQDYLGNYEVILVNNRSSDNTAELAEKYKVKIINALECQSSYYARNVGLACSSSQIVAFTDSDCIADKKWLHYLVQHLVQNRKTGGVGGGIVHFSRNKMEAIFGDQLGIRHDTKGAMPYLVTANAAYWRKVVREIGDFDATFRSAGDVDFSWRIMKRGYEIALEPRAITYHFPRKDVFSFFEQYYKYGVLGHAKLRRKHKIKGNQVTELTLLLKNESIIVGSLSYRVLKALFDRKYRNSAVTLAPVFSAVTIFAYRLGAIRGYKAISV